MPNSVAGSTREVYMCTTSSTPPDSRGEETIVDILKKALELIDSSAIQQVLKYLENEN